MIDQPKITDAHIRILKSHQIIVEVKLKAIQEPKLEANLVYGVA